MVDRGEVAGRDELVTLRSVVDGFWAQGGRRALGTDIHHAISQAVEEESKRLPSYQRISDYAVSREP